MRIFSSLLSAILLSTSVSAIASSTEKFDINRETEALADQVKTLSLDKQVEHQHFFEKIADLERQYETAKINSDFKLLRETAQHLGHVIGGHEDVKVPDLTSFDGQVSVKTIIMIRQMYPGILNPLQVLYGWSPGKPLNDHLLQLLIIDGIASRLFNPAEFSKNLSFLKLFEEQLEQSSLDRHFIKETKSTISALHSDDLATTLESALNSFEIDEWKKLVEVVGLIREILAPAINSAAVINAAVRGESIQNEWTLFDPQEVKKAIVERAGIRDEAKMRPASSSNHDEDFIRPFTPFAVLTCSNDDANSKTISFQYDLFLSSSTRAPSEKPITFRIIKKLPQRLNSRVLSQDTIDLVDKRRSYHQRITNALSDIFLAQLDSDPIKEAEAKFKVAKLGHFRELVGRVLEPIRTGDIAENINLCVLAAERGYFNGYVLNLLLVPQVRTSIDPKLQRVQFKINAFMGDALAMLHYGRMICDGIGGSSDPIKGWSLIKESASEGNVSAMAQMANFHSSKREFKEAARYWVAVCQRSTDPRHKAVAVQNLQTVSKVTNDPDISQLWLTCISELTGQHSLF